MVTVYQLARCHNSEHFNLKKHRCENIKSRKTVFFLQQAFFYNKWPSVLRNYAKWNEQISKMYFDTANCKPEYLHITSNRVIRQAVGSRFVQHDHQKDRIEEHCERPLKAVKSFSQ